MLNKLSTTTWSRSFTSQGTRFQQQNHSGRPTEMNDKQQRQDVEQKPVTSTRRLSSELNPFQRIMNSPINRLC